jgi:large exoprotein involved in heme utilization and adhesion
MGCGGQSGRINVVANNALTLLNNGQIVASTATSGDANNISIHAKNITIDGKSHLAGIYSISSCTDAFETCGNAGNVRVFAEQTLNIFNGGQISSSTFTRGNAGSVSVTANTINIDGNNHFTGIFSQSYGDGETTYVGGNAGNINVTAYNSLNLADGGQISTGTETGGNAGDITLNTKGALNIADGGNISSSTESEGKAGNITLNAGHVNIDGQSNSETGLFSRAGKDSSGRTGNIYVNAGSVLVTGKGQMSIEYDAKVSQQELQNLKKASINIDAGELELNNGGSINASSTGNAPASGINIDSDKLTMHNAEITTSAKHADGGPINIQSGLAQLTDSRITTSAGGNGDGGDINIAGNALILNGGFIQANAAGEDSSGGDVRVAVDTLLASHGQLQVGGDQPYTFRPGFNVIQAASPNGVSGTINTTAPELNISGAMLNLKSDFLDKPDLDADPCTTGGDSTFVQAGYGGLPPDQDGGVYVPDHFEAAADKRENKTIPAVSAGVNDASTCNHLN